MAAQQELRQTYFQRRENVPSSSLITQSTIATIAVYERDYLMGNLDPQEEGAFRDELVGYAEITSKVVVPAQGPELVPVLSAERANQGNRFRKGDIYRQDVRARRQAERATRTVNDFVAEEQRRIAESQQRRMTSNDEGYWLRSDYINHLKK